ELAHPINVQNRPLKPSRGFNGLVSCLAHVPHPCESRGGADRIQKLRLATTSLGKLRFNMLGVLRSTGRPESFGSSCCKVMKPKPGTFPARTRRGRLRHGAICN